MYGAKNLGSVHRFEVGVKTNIRFVYNGSTGQRKSSRPGGNAQKFTIAAISENNTDNTTPLH